MNASPARDLLITVDAVGRCHFTFQKRASSQVGRFERYRSLVATDSPQAEHRDAFLLAGALAFGNVCDAVSLRSMHEALRSPLRWRECLIVGWCAADDRHAIRVLSPLLAAACVLTPDPPPYEVAHAALLQWLDHSQLYPRRPEDPPLERLLEDARAWHAAYLPPYLAAHVIGVARLADVPVSCLAREQARKPLAQDGSAAIDSEASKALLRLFASRARAARPLQWAQMRARVTSAMARADVAEYIARKHAIEEIGSLQQEAADLTFGQRLIVGFAVSLLSSGTPLSPQLALSTCLDYWSVSADLLLAVADALAKGSREEDELLGIYSRCIDAAHPGVRHKVSAALRAFHAFAADLLDLPVLAGPVSRAVFSTPAPRANLIWPHEQALVTEYYTRLGERNRLAAQVAAVHVLACGTGRRIGEILTLTMQCLRPRPDGQLVVAVDPLPTYDRTKTPAARGVFTASRDADWSALLSWLARRHSEGAKARDLVFGAPGRAGVYEETLTTIILRGAYKAVTGDASAVIHTARHSYLSFALASIDATADAERRSAQVAVDAGHVTSATTHVNYNHLSFMTLGSCNDLLERKITLSSADAARWLGTTATSLRKRASRAKIDGPSFVAGQLAELRRRWHCPQVQDQFKFGGAPTFPLPSESREVRFLTVLQVLKDLLAETPLARTARRADVPESVVLAIVKAATDIGRIATPAEVMSASVSRLAGAALFAVTGAYTLVGVHHPKLERLHAWLASTTPEEVRAGTTAWARTRRGLHVSLEKPHLLADLLTLMKDSAVDSGTLLVRFAHRANDSSDDRASLERAVRERLRGVFGAAVETELAAERRGRPRAYLLIRSKSEDRSSAGLGMTGFHALLFVAWIFSNLGPLPGGSQ